MKAFKLLPIVLIIPTFVKLNACKDFPGCNECADLGLTKMIKFVDKEGKSLFITDSTLVLDSIKFFASKGKNLMLEYPGLNSSLDSINGTIIFSPGETQGLFIFDLSESYLADTLSFTFKEEPSEECCGNRPVTTGAFLNGRGIANDDVIMITPRKVG